MTNKKRQSAPSVRNCSRPFREWRECAWPGYYPATDITDASRIANSLNQKGEELVNAFRTDTRNLYAGTATLTQPIFMGGKIIAYNKITKYAEQLAESQHATGMQDLILNTDQAYWQVISLVNKRKLAEVS